MTTVRTAVIETERLTLLPLRVEHAEEMAGVLSDPALHTFIGGRPSTEEELRGRYTRMVAGSPDPAFSWCNWVLTERAGPGELSGTVQATVTPHRTLRDETVAEISWVVGTPWQGRGFATEAARGLVRWLAEQGVGTVIAHIHPEHRASGAVAAAVGLSPTDEWHDGEVRWRRRFGE
ncbi:GNAT family N-acetyltransferase [Streptomyces sp. NPDC101062]|uniref:GNAT family N-acetyltransferase n=1 Tax=unclassified Streptomyces TaxID=2593676 RepID=UPI002E77FF0F|nr:GNAT family N-acetyltransferase [Streptomyces sp. JV176]MEE1801464.1 GNAT family N-acetyltransferase [Streptomyces sp. JV176]